MIFSELYGAYYNAVAAVLRQAVEKPVTKSELREIVEKNAFGESVLNLEPAITEGRWQLLTRDGTTPLKRRPTMPLTNLEKRWLKAICMDPRIRLFCDEIPDLPDVEPLFKPEDVFVFDRYADGDPYEDDAYVARFRSILAAIRDRTPLSIDMRNRKGGITHTVVMPDHLEYSEKDDKFRLIGSDRRYGEIVNLARIVRCKPYPKPYEYRPMRTDRSKAKTVEFELFDQRNALERALLHFAHFEKQAERLDEKRYRIKIFYDEDDETEMVIRILSFGPMVKVTSPQAFIDLIKDRLKKQKSCEL